MMVSFTPDPQLYPDAHVTRLAGANHYIQEDAPGALAAAVQKVVGGKVTDAVPRRG